MEVITTTASGTRTAMPSAKVNAEVVGTDRLSATERA